MAATLEDYPIGHFAGPCNLSLDLRSVHSFQPVSSALCTEDVRRFLFSLFLFSSVRGIHHLFFIGETLENLTIVR